MIVDWETGGRLIPLDLGVGRVLRIGRQRARCFIEPLERVARRAGALVWHHGGRGPAVSRVLAGAVTFAREAST